MFTDTNICQITGNLTDLQNIFYTIIYTIFYIKHNINKV